jgi:protein-S-isoprenylcysteine O-methyltransferase Ste14
MHFIHQGRGAASVYNRRGVALTLSIQGRRYHFRMAVQNDVSRGEMFCKSMLLLAGFVLIVAALMFGPAGIAWQQGWLFFVVFWAYTISSAVYLWRVNPEIYVARSNVHAGTKSWDKVLMVLLLASLLAIFLVAALDARYAWSAVSKPLVVAGYILFTIGFAITTWVYAVNRFAEPSVRIQSDRGQEVVDTGPYAIVRHPLYAASIVLFVGMSLAMGSYWALVPVAVGLLVIIVRIVLEDRLLQNELAGYKEYASRVQYRLVPGVW